MSGPWFILYDGSSSDGLGPGRFCGRTTDHRVAWEHFIKCNCNPYSTGFVKIVTDEKEFRALWESDFSLPQAGSAMPECVYEMVDASDEETYYPIGMFLRKDLAVQVLGEMERFPPGFMPNNDTYVRLEIREREIGFGSVGKPVASRTWVIPFESETGKFEAGELIFV